MTDGIILIDKPSHMTSFGVVARVRRQLSEAAGHKVKVGHTGTLDPFATGLMILVIGKECKNAGTYSKLDKVYDATIRLGEVSTTGDPEGEITVGKGKGRVAREEIEGVLQTFIGDIEQRPPIYSAIKVGGQRAYRLARSGEVFEIPKRTITIHSLELLTYGYPEMTIRTHVSSGTYIRTLATDIGELLGTGAYTTALRRLSIDRWDVGDADTSYLLT